MLSYDLETGTPWPSKILEVVRKRHDILVTLGFDDARITSTDDHPYWVDGKGWCSTNPEKSKAYKGMERTRPLQIGDEVLFLDPQGSLTPRTLRTPETLTAPRATNTITKLTKHNTFFAEGVLVGMEEVE